MEPYERGLGIRPRIRRKGFQNIPKVHWPFAPQHVEGNPFQRRARTGQGHQVGTTPVGFGYACANHLEDFVHKKYEVHGGGSYGLNLPPCRNIGRKYGVVEEGGREFVGWCGAEEEIVKEGPSFEGRL